MTARLGQFSGFVTLKALVFSTEPPGEILNRLFR